MEYYANISKNSFIILYFIFFVLFLKYVSTTQLKWDFDKGGEDWPNSCKEGNQAPIDISKPFEYKSNLIKK